MSFREFQSTFYETLKENPLPNHDYWRFERMRNYDLRNKECWREVLYRTCASYQCDHAHRWNSSWTIIIFLYRLNAKQIGEVRMKRFGQRCKYCKDDEKYHVGFCSHIQTWYAVQCLLLNIVQRCYKNRHDDDFITEQYTITISDVPSIKGKGMPHHKEGCEACANGRCQDKFKKEAKKKSS